VNEPAIVTIQGTAASVGSDNTFKGTRTLNAGSNSVTVSATDQNGNTSIANYDVAQPADATSFTYDANGNVTSDGARTFEWDAANNLVHVVNGADSVSILYDGQ